MLKFWGIFGVGIQRQIGEVKFKHETAVEYFSAGSQHQIGAL